MQLPAAMPDCEQPGAFNIGAHWLIGLPAQMHVVKSGHDTPTDFTGSRQLVVMHVLHESADDGASFATHATMSVDPPALVVEGALSDGVGVLAVGCAPEGDDGAGVGSDPHATRELTTKATTKDARLSMVEARA